MNQVRNYQKELEKILQKIEQDGAVKPPRLLLHSCCAPCSSYCLTYLRQYFAITVFYYNPNISMEEEYQRRVAEQIRLIGALNEQQNGYEITFIEGDYDTKAFYEMAQGLEHCREGGERCFLCYDLRLRKTAQLAEKGSYDYFATTLTISPLKNAAKLNEIGELLAKELTVNWLPSDFKKRNGYKCSVALSAEYGLYRQDYCGCVYSKLERERQKKESQQQ